MEAKAIAKYVRMSPIKIGVVLDLIRGKNVQEALLFCSILQRMQPLLVNKVLKSAVANAENNNDMDASERLYVTEAYVGPGPILKRFRPHAQGKAFRIKKRTSNITLVVKERA